ncbi:M56 family metallopeptidase [Sporosarcina cascadiensis]|uniref:M56 family metallopeptidase n=1 Tax=Sporosarcina cascadiensis TaxID=2660747 RepID=UPI00129A1207|nr:M56 family metallopeptidase [Sporosarcina cascadiensis]
MSLFLELLVTLTVSGSIIVCCILLMSLISPDVFPAKVRYIITKSAVCFYLLPIAFIAERLMTFLSFKSGQIGTASGTVTLIPETAAGNIRRLIPEYIISFEIISVLLSLWATGVLTFSIWQIYCYQRFLKNIRASSMPVSNDSEAATQLIYMKQVVGIKEIVRIKYNSSIKSPVLVGLLKPTILLPANDKLDMDLGMVIRHELVHLKRKDLWVKMLVLSAGAIHWFNPLVHVLRKDIHTWSELSCDAEVVKDMSHDERKRYGETILNVMIGSRGLPIKFCSSLSGDGIQLKRRLTMMLNVKKLKKHTKFMTVITILIIGAIGTSTAVWAAKITPEVTGTVKTQIAADEKKGGSTFSDGSEYDYAFSALSSDQQKQVTKEMAHYYLDEQRNVVYFSDLHTDSVPFTSLTAEQQLQATKEIGWYSLKIIREQKTSVE